MAALLFCYTGVAAQSLAPPAYDPAIALKSALPADAESATSVCSAGTTITLILPTNQWGTVQSCGMCVQCAALLPACMPQRAAGSVHATRLPCHSRALPAFRRPGALLNFKRTPHALSGGQQRATSTLPPRRYAPSRPSVPAPQWLVTFVASRVSAYCFVSVAGGLDLSVTAAGRAASTGTPQPVSCNQDTPISFCGLEGWCRCERCWCASAINWPWLCLCTHANSTPCRAVTLVLLL